MNAGDDLFAAWRRAVDDALEESLIHAAGEPRLTTAMRAALSAGGKRLRPLLVLGAARACGGSIEAALPAAVAVELIHTYSLIHDDLPAMDDAELRRGQPCVHIAFGEALGILAGDALHTLAFQQLVAARLPPAVIVELVRSLAIAAGVAGMAGGQSLDLEFEGRGAAVDERQVAAIHRMKTGALLAVAFTLGGLAAEAAPEQIEALTAAGQEVGLAFQIQDDLLDLTSDTATLGKSAGRDQAVQKATWPAAVGIEESRRRVAALTAGALERLRPFGADADPLRRMVRSAAERVT